MTNWSHQTRAVEEVLALISKGERRILLTSPTGMGKTVVARLLAEHYLADARAVSFYTNRRLLVGQTSEAFAAAGLDHGVRAAEWTPDEKQLLQVTSLQTEHARVVRKKSQSLHPADLVIVDEAHLQSSKSARSILDTHLDQGAVLVGLTATPIDLGHLYTTLVTAGTVSEGRACGALVAAYHYGPDEPDLRHVGRVALGDDPTEGQSRKAIMTPSIFGRVWEWWTRLNPLQKPTILFAPGVPESVWFAEQFTAAGVPAAHIDGEEVWFNGKSYRSERGIRKELLEGSKSGKIKVVCNRFCLREGIDAPWLQVGIIATVVGSLQSYLQMAGRLLRASPGKDKAIIIDHAGCWHRLGSVNADREWAIAMTPAMAVGLRQDRIRNKLEPEPVRCPQCGLILSRLRCLCGFTINPRKKSRPVIQVDGTLRTLEGDIYRSRETRELPDTQKLWTTMYYRAKNGGMTFTQARGLFLVENGYQPPDTLKLMPLNPKDWYRQVAAVPREALRS